MTQGAAAAVRATGAEETGRERFRSLALFFGLTFALAWALWLLAGALAPAGSLGQRAPFFLPGTFSPAIVALALNARAHPRGGAADLLGPLFRWRVPVRYYVFALGFMVSVKLAAAAAHRVVNGDWPAFGSVPLALLLLAAVFSTPVQAGEEIGWRGYALPRMARVIGYRAAGLLLGVLWALWHLPLFYMAGTDTTGQPFPVYLLSVTALSVAMTWLWVRTGRSLLPVMLMHAAVNNTTGIVPAATPGAADPMVLHATAMAWLTCMVLWLAAGFFLVRLGHGPRREARPPGVTALASAPPAPRAPPRT